MKRGWTEEELVERWTLFPDELALVESKTGHNRLGLAVMLRFFAGEGRFPRDKHEVPVEVLRFVGEQAGEPAEAGPEGWLRYDWRGRSIKYHRAEVRRFFGFREATARDGVGIAAGPSAKFRTVNEHWSSPTLGRCPHGSASPITALI